MYTSWYKNDPDPPTENGVSPPPQPSHRGTIWLVALVLASFILVGVAVFFPSPGLLLALIGFPLLALIFALWLLRILGV